MRTGREAGVLFWYRTSPRHLMAYAFFGEGLMKALMPMVKIDIETLKRAHAGLDS